MDTVHEVYIYWLLIGWFKLYCNRMDLALWFVRWQHSRLFKYLKIQIQPNINLWVEEMQSNLSWPSGLAMAIRISLFGDHKYIPSIIFPESNTLKLRRKQLVMGVQNWSMNENFNFGLSQSQNHCSQQYVHVSFMLIHVDTRAASGRFISAAAAAAGWEGEKNRGAGCTESWWRQLERPPTRFT